MTSDRVNTPSFWCIELYQKEGVFMTRGTKIICLRRKVLTAVGCVVAAFLMCWVVSSPKVVGAAATERQLPIYCVQKDYKVLSISFDAAWGDAKVR